MSRYLVLLRGINVGGKNLIGMPALKAAFEAAGFGDVVTYIQSGNVLVSSGERGAALVPRGEALLSKAFDYSASVVVLSSTQLRRVVEHAPDGFGTRPERFRYDVLFLKAPLTAAQALARVPVNPDVDRSPVRAGSCLRGPRGTPGEPRSPRDRCTCPSGTGRPGSRAAGR
jgi:uncharacterized protein (DUF1697 family)